MFVMGPKTDDLDDAFVLVNLINEPVLDIDAPRVSAFQFPDDRVNSCSPTWCRYESSSGKPVSTTKPGERSPFPRPEFVVAFSPSSRYRSDGNAVSHLAG